jgi:N4-gp56 family major capsid protein
MGSTDFGSLSDLQKKVWSLETYKQGRDDSFFMSNGFMGTNTSDSTKPIHRVTELTETDRGTEAVLPLVADLTGGGVVGDNQLEGNEESLVTDAQTIRIDQLRNGVKSRGRLSEQKTVLRFRVQGKDALAFWLADTIDELTFLTGAGRAYSLNTDGSARGTSQLPQLSFAADVSAASSNRVIYAGSATSEATLTASDKMNWDTIIQAKAFAKRKRIRPIRAAGKSFYIFVMSTEQMRDLESSSDYKTLTAQALPRGLDNPLFTNAKKVIGDVVLYDHQKVFNTLGLGSGSRWGSGGTVHGAQAMLMGAQAVGFAQLNEKSMGWAESDNTDYQNRQGIGVGRMLGLLKPKFKSRYDSNSTEDFGVVQVKTAAAAS